jgi:hypothetical protein
MAYKECMRTKATRPVYTWPLTLPRIDAMTPGLARHWLHQLDLLRKLLPPVKERKGRPKDPRIASEDPYLSLRILLAMSETDLRARIGG